MRRSSPAIILLLLTTASPLFGATAVLTRSYDNGRTGANITEDKLTPANVVRLKRIKSFKVPDDPRIEAQPLYVPGLLISKDNKRHNAVVVASMGNHVYAFDADAPEDRDLLWDCPLGQPFEPPPTQLPDPGKGIRRRTDIDYWGINIRWGILSTPVIDRDKGRIYVVNWVKVGDFPTLTLHEISLNDGREVRAAQPIRGIVNDAAGRPVVDARGIPLQLLPGQQQRAALLLSPLRAEHKTLFIATTGGENPGDPHGWMTAFDVDTFTQTAAVPVTQQGFGGGMWQGSQGPSSDDAGNIFAMTGNGGFNAKLRSGPDPSPGKVGDFNGVTDFAEAFVKFAYRKPANGRASLRIADWFIPFRDSERAPPASDDDPDYQDQDLGAGGPVLPPGTSLVLGAGKDGLLYVLDRNNLGKKVGDLKVLKTPPVYITFNGLGLPVNGRAIDFPTLGKGPLQPSGPPTKTHHLHASPVYWNGPDGPMLFNWGENESLRAWNVDPTTGRLTFLAKGAEVASRALADASEGRGGMTGGMVSLSSNGKAANTGIVWTLTPVDGDANRDVAPGIARAYDATSLDTAKNADGTSRLKLLWESNGVPFSFSKFCPPVVADGRLYVATYDGRVDVYGLTN